MQFTISYRFVVAACALSLVVGCGKRNADKPVGKTAKDSSTLSKDSTGVTKDSTAAVNDATGAAKDSTTAVNDTTAKGKDSTTSTNDSTHAADSLAAHPPPILSYEQRQGQYVYAKYCATCHGVEGKADGFNTYNLDPKPRDFTEQHYLSEFPDARLIQIIRDGGRGANKAPSMPPYGWTLGKDDITYVAAFVRTFIPPDSVKQRVEPKK